MSDSEIIWKFLTSEYLDDHVVVYLYCSGNIITSKTSIDHAFNFLKQIFCPAIPESLVKSTVTAYLNYKKKQYNNAEINIKPQCLGSIHWLL